MFYFCYQNLDFVLGEDEFEAALHGSEAAVKTLEDAVPVAISHLGPEHDMVIKTKKDIAQLHKKMGAYEDATNVLQEVESLERKVHGDMSVEVRAKVKV